MQKFNGRENFTFFERLAATERIQSRITSLQDEVGKAEQKLAALRFKDPSVGVARHRSDLRKSLIEGNTPEFEHLLWSSFVTENERSVAHLAAKRFWGQLRKNSKTLNNLSYFAGQPIWPLENDWLQRISIIYEKYAQAYLPDATLSLSPETQDYCSTTMAAIQWAQESMADEVTRNWRGAEAVLLEHQQTFDRERSGMEDLVGRLREELRQANEEFEASVRVIVSQRYPSLKDIFRELARKKKMQTARNTVGEALVKLSSSLLKPETLIKIVEALK